MKLQMGLMGLLLATLPLLLLTPWAGLLTGGVLLTFLLTTLPFVAKAWGKDRAVALASPLLLAARALALGAGYGWGLVYRQNPRGSTAPNTISGPNYLFKRFLDIVGSVFGLLLTAVMIPILALAIKLDSPGPVIFRQQRLVAGQFADQALAQAVAHVVVAAGKDAVAQQQPGHRLPLAALEQCRRIRRPRRRC